MGVFSLCRKYVNQLPRGKVFVTRELLPYGHRDAIDKCTQAMVGRMMVLRLARGVFVRNDPGLEIPSIKEIAEAKARAFAKRIIPSGIAQAAMLGLEKPIKLRKKGNRYVRPKPPFRGVSFAVLGTTSEFWTIHGYVQLKHISARKFFAAQHKVGELLTGIWHASADADINFQLLLWRANFSVEEHLQFRQLAAWVPEWVHEQYRSLPLAGKIHAPWRLYPFDQLEFPRSLEIVETSKTIKEPAAVYRVGIKCGDHKEHRRRCEDALDLRDSLGLLTACTGGEHNFSWEWYRFSSP